MTKIDPQDLRHSLADFTGSEHWYRHPLAKDILYTDGVAFFAEAAECHWLLDIICTQPEIVNQMRDDGFAVIELDVSGDDTAEITCDDGNGNIKYRRHLDFTDAPVGVWRFFFTDNTILLPSEY